MAVNVLVIPEDFRKDQYVLKPIIEKMFVAMKVKARVQVCRDPLPGGIGEALKRERIEDILDRYKGMIRVFLLIVDRDCDPTRRNKLDGMEGHAAAHLEGGNHLFMAEVAHQEVEVWVLAGLKDLPKEWAWKDVRSHSDPKEAYFDEISHQQGLTEAPYGGRERLAREAAGRYGRICQLCPEVDRLQGRLHRALMESQQS